MDRGSTSDSGSTAQRIGPYVLLRRLGGEAGSQVYLAARQGLERQFALKVLPGNLSARAVERARREARIASGFDHPGLVPVHEVGEANGRLYVVMDYVPGSTLAERLASHGPLDPDVACELLADVAEALGAAHQAGVVHRALDPSMILLAPECPKLIGFSRTRQLLHESELTEPGELLGSIHYAAPESFEGVRGPPADVYSLGVVLYQALTGALPFPGDSVPAVLEALQTTEPQPPSALAPGISADLDALCLRQLAADPSQRLPDAAALATALRACAPGEDAAPEGRALILVVGLIGAGLAALLLGWGLSQRGAAHRAELLRVELGLRREAAEEERASLRLEQRQQAAALERAEAAWRESRQRAEAARERVSAIRAQLAEVVAWGAAPRPEPARVVVDVASHLTDHPGLRETRARLLRDAGRCDQALAALGSGGSDAAEALRVEVLEELGQAREALAARAALAAQPESALSLWARAGQRETGPPERQRLIARARELGGSPHVEVLGALSGAPGLLETALHAWPSDPRLLWLRSVERYTRWLQGGRRDDVVIRDCLDDLRRVRGLRPQASYWTYMGKTMLMQGRGVAADAELAVGERLANLPHEQALLLAWKGVAHLERAEPEAAAADWLEAIRIAPQAHSTYEFLGYLERLPPRLRAQVEAAVPAQLRRPR